MGTAHEIFTALIWARAIERYAVAVAAFFCLYLGVSLLRQRVSGKSDLIVEAGENKRLQLLNASPGLVLSVAAIVILGILAGCPAKLGVLPNLVVSGEKAAESQAAATASIPQASMQWSNSGPPSADRLPPAEVRETLSALSRLTLPPASEQYLKQLTEKAERALRSYDDWAGRSTKK